MVLNKSSKTHLGQPGILSRVPNNDQVLRSTRKATPFLHVPRHYQHEANETSHVHKIMTIMKKWSVVPHLHADGDGNQAMKFYTPISTMYRKVVSHPGYVVYIFIIYDRTLAMC